MPYRRLPNTDVARLKALKKALEKGKENPPFNLAFSQSTYRKVLSFVPRFEKAMIQYKSTYTNQVRKNNDYIKVQKKAKIYISHFIQVLNMAITRGELPENTRDFFQLSGTKVPALNTEESLIKWGERIIRGAEERKMKMLTPITNPTDAVVKVRYEAFLDAFRFQKILQKDNKRALDELAALRSEGDNIIVDIWNEVEESFKDMPDNIKREKAEEYGLIYVFRKNELRQINFNSTKSLVNDLQLLVK